ncbi:hypothetical protein WICPIJ_007726 [Wickerhamomyces pijperi]|uniref:Uncharacterized protein n=1 Tax=Wickerhamomyces pijperi TaxID=599730 RepID=A0A9P8Q1W3_WICPI|nr:hypothetical protein WICPIJ_007726 [Wickerhamomyces pijperi]
MEAWAKRAADGSEINFGWDGNDDTGDLLTQVVDSGVLQVFQVSNGGFVDGDLLRFTFRGLDLKTNVTRF